MPDKFTDLRRITRAIKSADFAPEDLFYLASFCQNEAVKASAPARTGGSDEQQLAQ